MLVGDEAAIEQRDHAADQRVQHEHRAHRVQHRPARVRAPPRGPRGRERTHGRAEPARQRVAREQRGAGGAVDRRACEPRVLQRQEHADVAGARVQRADEGHQRERPERMQPGEAQAGGHHRQCRRVQQSCCAKAMPQCPDRDRRGSRPGQRQGAEHADVHHAHAQRAQVGGQQHRDVAVGEAAQHAAGEQPGGGGLDAGGQDPGGHAHAGIVGRVRGVRRQVGD